MAGVSKAQQGMVLTVEETLCRLSSRRSLRVPALALRQGEHWCLFGGNGAGKSVLARLLCGQLLAGSDRVHWAPGLDPRHDACLVSFEEQQALAASDNRHDISEYSAAALDQGTTVQALICGAQALSPAREARLQTLLATLGLQGLRDRGIRYLSSGQTRKALLARALFQAPRLLVLDDPLESVDQDSRAGVLQAILESMKEDTCTLLLCRRERDILPGITHMVLMDALSVTAQGRLEDVRAMPAYHALLHRQATIPQTLPPPLPGRHQPQPAEEVPLLALRDVSAGYGDTCIFEHLTWTLRRGQHAVISGPNGCGKSTLLSLLNGENHKAYGQDVRLFGRRRGSGETVWEVKSRFGLVSNELHNRYIRGWRVLDVVVSGFFDSVGLYDDSGASEQGAARAWLQAFGIESLGAQLYHHLSFGEQRLVLLARAMVKHPAILILDEPCVGLDDHYRTFILSIVDRIASTTATQILFVSHQQDEVPRCINQWLSFSPSGVAVRE